MNKHIFLHAWSIHSDTLEIRIQHNVTPDQSRSDLHRIIDILILFMHGSRRFCQRGSNSATLTIILDLESGSKYHLKRTNVGPPAKRHLNGVSLACILWSTLNAGFIALRIFENFKKTYIFVIFQGGPDPLSPPLDPRMLLNTQLILGRIRWGSR